MPNHLSSRPSRRRKALGTALLAGALAAAFAPAHAAPAGRVVLGGHASPLARASALIGAEPAGAAVSLAVSLPPRDRAGLAEAMRRLYDPADPLYKHFLTPGEYTARFGPTQAQYDAVVRFLTASGLSVTKTYPGRTQVDVAGTVGRVNAAFGTQVKRFLAADGTTFRALDSDISVPAALAGSISGVTGLDGSLKATPHFKVLGLMAAPGDAATPDFIQRAPQGSGIFNTFSPSDIKTAYNLRSTTLDGTGQTVGLVEFDSTYNPKDVLKYCALVGITRPRVQNVFVNSGGLVSKANSYALEFDLDIDLALSLAPKSLVLVYMVPFNNGQGALDELQRIINDDKATAISASYGFGAESAGAPSSFQVSLNDLLGQMAMQGQSFFISSGDSGSSTSRSTFVKGVDQFGSLPNSCTVGGTDLAVTTPKTNESYLSETTWNINGTPGGGAGGGGVSLNWTIPSYQTGAANAAAASAAVSTTMRNIPDVSLNASPDTGYLVPISDYPGTKGLVYGIVGGTSASSPLWAGFTALVNQNNVRNGNGLLGFPNPSLYAFGPGGSNASSYTTVFHDVADLSSNSTDPDTADTQFIATTGFDDATGLGSFNGQKLIQALSGSTP